MVEITHPLYQEDIRNILSIKGIELLKNKSFLITGSTGMVGTMLIDALLSLGGVRIIAVGRDRQKIKERWLQLPGFSFLEHDVCNPFSEKLKVDYILPMASNTHPMAYSQYPIETIMVNIKGCEHALNLADKTGATLVMTSTNEVYGNAINNEDFYEDSNGVLNLCNARSCYNESKRTCEAMCQSYKEEHGTKVKIARLCRIFGPTMLMSDSKASSQFIKKALAGEDIILKSEGNQYFSYTYVADAVIGLLTVLLNGEYGVPYNVSSNKTNIRLKDFAQICAEACNRKVVFDLPSDAENKGYSLAQRAILNNDRIKAIGFQPKYEIRDAILRTIEILKTANNG